MMERIVPLLSLSDKGKARELHSTVFEHRGKVRKIVVDKQAVHGKLLLMIVDSVFSELSVHHGPFIWILSFFFEKNPSLSHGFHQGIRLLM